MYVYIYVSQAEINALQEKVGDSDGAGNDSNTEEEEEVVLQGVAVFFSVMQRVAVRCSALQCVASAIQCVAVCCRVMQSVAV